MRKIHFLGLTGHARAGKDTVADYLVENHAFVKLAFAGELKELLTEIDPPLGIDHDFWVTTSWNEELAAKSEDELKASNQDYRRLLLRTGDALRKRDPNFFVRALYRRVSHLVAEGHDRIVVSDVRYPNEAELFKGNLIQITRPGTEPSPGSYVHSSESHVGNLGESKVIVNDGSPVLLKRRIREALNLNVGG